MSESTTMSAILMEYGALHTTPPATAAFLGAIATLPKMLAPRVRKQVVRHWTVQHLVHLIWHVGDVRRIRFA